MNVEQKPNRRHIFVYLALASFHSQEKGCAWPSVKTLSTAIGCKEDDVWKSLKWLEAGGWIRKEIKPGQSTKYFIYDWLNRPLQETPKAAVELPVVDPPPKRGVPPKQGVTPTPQMGGTNYIKELDIEIKPKGGRSAVRKGKAREIFLTDDLIPTKLKFASEQLCAFWNAYKAGEKSEAALRIMFMSCIKILEHEFGGKQEVMLQIESGIEAFQRKGKLWQSISYANWWKYIGSKKQETAQAKTIQYTL